MLYLGVVNKISYRIYIYIYIYIWQSSEYATVSKYVRVLNMSVFIKKALHHIDCIYQGSKYAKVTQGSEQNAPL